MIIFRSHYGCKLVMPWQILLPQQDARCNAACLHDACDGVSLFTWMGVPGAKITDVPRVSGRKGPCGGPLATFGGRFPSSRVPGCGQMGASVIFVPRGLERVRGRERRGAPPGRMGRRSFRLPR